MPPVLHRRTVAASLGVTAVLAGSLLAAVPASAKSIKEWRAALARVKSCRVLPKETFASSLHAEVLFSKEAGVGLMVPVKAQERLTYLCGKQKAGVFFYDVGPKAAPEAFSFVAARLWGGPEPTGEHPDRAYQKNGMVIVISAPERTPLDDVFGPAAAPSTSGARND